MAFYKKGEGRPTPTTEVHRHEVQELIRTALEQRSGIHALRAVQLIRKYRLALMSDENLDHFTEATVQLALLEASLKRARAGRR